jgi:hypothetical protein
VELEDHMKQLKYFDDVDKKLKSDVIKGEEAAQKKLWKTKQKEINLQKEEMMNKKKNDELKERMDRVYVKSGRVTMPRSHKPQVKREVQVVKIDQETLDRQRYLGEVIPEPL